MRYPTAYIFSQDKAWLTADGRTLIIKEMDTDHIENTMSHLLKHRYAWLKRWWHDSLGLSVDSDEDFVIENELQGAILEDILENVAMWIMSVPVYIALSNELNDRSTF